MTVLAGCSSSYPAVPYVTWLFLAASCSGSGPPVRHSAALHSRSSALSEWKIEESFEHDWFKFTKLMIFCHGLCHKACSRLKVHKHENFFGSDFEFFLLNVIPNCKMDVFVKTILDLFYMKEVSVASTHTQ
jgi:hypothetical protein